MSSGADAITVWERGTEQETITDTKAVAQYFGKYTYLLFCIELDDKIDNTDNPGSIYNIWSFVWIKQMRNNMLVGEI